MNTNEKPENVFKSRNYRLVFFGALVSELGAVLYSFAVSFYILELTENNAFLQGLYLALCGAVFLVATPIGGVLGDRLNKAKIMFLCDYIRGTLILLAMLGMLLFPAQKAHLFILFAAGVLGNAIGGIFSPAAGALLPHIVDEQRLQQANAYFSVKSALQSIFGVVLAGVLYAALSIQTLFLVVGLCYILSGVSEMFIRYTHTRSADRLTLRLALTDIGEGMRYLGVQKPILVLMLGCLFINFFVSPIYGNFIPYFVKTDIALAPAYLLDRVLTPELWSSVFNMMIGVSTLIGSVILSARPQEDKVGHKTAVRLCIMAGILLALTLGYVLLVDRSGKLDLFLVLFCLGTLLIGFFLPYINIPINTVLMRVVDRDKLSKVTSFTSILSQGLIPIGSMLAGIVLQSFGSSMLLILSTLGFAATALALLFSKETGKI